MSLTSLAGPVGLFDPGPDRPLRLVLDGSTFLVQGGSYCAWYRVW